MLDPTTTQASPISSQPSGPREVVASFLRLTVDTPDLKKAKLHLTKRSVASGSFDAAAVPAGSTYTLGAEEADELGRRIPVSVKSPAPGGTEIQEMTVPVIVVQEDGEWRIDLPATMERLMGGMTAALGDAMGAMGEALATAMTGVGEVLAEGMAAGAPVKDAVVNSTPVKAVGRSVSKVKKFVNKLVKKVAAKKAAAKVAKKPVGKSVKKAVKKVLKKTVKKPAKKTAGKASKKRH